MTQTQPTERIQAVDVRNFDMSFGRMVVFMIKWAIATIPALLILIAVGFSAIALLGGFVAALTGRPGDAVPAPTTLEHNAGTTDPAARTTAPGQAPPAARSAPHKHERPSEVDLEIARAKELLARGQYQQAYDAAEAIEGATGLDAYTVESVKNQAINLSMGRIRHKR